MGPAQTGLANGRKADAKRRAIPSLLLLLLMLLLLRPWLHAAAFESPWFNRALSVPITVLLFCLTLASYDLACIWRELDKFLALIDLMPLRPAFRRIARDWPKRPIWALNQHLSKTFLAKQMLAVLHNRRVVLGTKEACADVTCFWESIPSRFNGNGKPQTAPPSVTAAEAALVAIVQDQTVVMPAAPAVAMMASPAASIVPAPAVSAAAAPAGAAVAVASVPQVASLCLPLIPAHKRKPASTEEEFLRARREHEKICARMLSRIVTSDLLPIWANNVNDEAAERHAEEKVSKEELLRTYCSDFVALQFTRYLVYVVGQIQAIAWCLSFCLLMLMLVLISYSPQAPLLLGRFLTGIFVLIGVVVFWVFAGMERNAILSRISGTQPGQLNQEFWFRLIGMGILPLIGVLSHLFPSLSNFFAAWVGSGAEAFR